MLKKLSAGLCGLFALGIGVADVSGKTPNVLHEMVPHVVLPETIQYNKTAKNVPGVGYTGANSPYVATYVAHPSYQVSHTTEFRSVGQAVYPVAPPLLPAPLPKELPEPDAATEEITWQEIEGEDIVLSPKKMIEPIRLASVSEGVAPPLPMPVTIAQTRGLFCMPAPKPPAAWAFSSPLFKVASVPAGWGGQQAGGIVHSGPKGSRQHVGFQPMNGGDPATAGMVPQEQYYPAYPPEQNTGTQVQVLPNGMLLLTMPPSHNHCGLLRCKSSCAPRTMLLPPAGFFPQSAPQGMIPQGMMPQGMMLQTPTPQMAMMMPNDFGTPFMQVSQQPQMMPQMMPQMQTVPVTAMTPMGPAIVGHQQVPMMNPMMNPMAMNPMAMVNPQMQQLQQMPQMQMVVATANPAVASQAVAETGEGEGDDVQPPAMAVVATPFGYAIQVPTDALQGNAATQLAQIQQELVQSQQMQPMSMPMQIQMPMNPYTGFYATHFGYVAMNQSAGQFGFGQPMMMHTGFQPMGMSMQGQGMTISDMLQILAFINSNKPQRRGKLMERISERRENRREMATNDPFAQLMQAWTTPFVAPDTTLRMPAKNAHPYGYFGVQASPTNTANYGGYHNLYYGSTAYPGLY